MLEFCDTFKSIQKDTSDPVIAANEFINARSPINVINLELTRLLLDSSGFREPLPEHLVTNDDIDGILDWVDEKSQNIFPSAIPLQNSVYFKRCTLFFERVFILDWNTFANEGRFDTYFSRLLDAFSQWDLAQLFTISFAVQLKLVTAYLRGAGVEDGQRCRSNVMVYYPKLLEKSIYYKIIKCPILAATELYEWIKMDDSFATNENLRLITRCTKMEGSTLACHSLSIAYALLRMEHLNDKLTLFARKLVDVFSDLCFTENYHIFDWICRCCEFIYKYHRRVVSPNFMNDLLDNLFAKDRHRAKSVAGFWISSVFDPNCHRTNIRIILRFLANRRMEHWRVLVDSIIDDYQTIINWKLLVGILLDDDADVPKEIKLTLAEKGGLVVLMTYAIQEAVTGFPPEYRAANVKKLDLTACNEFSRQATEVLMPCFWKLFHLQYSDKEHIQVMLIYMIKFFDFSVIERKALFAFVQECLAMFERSRQPFCFQAVIDTLKSIAEKVDDVEVDGLCDQVFRCLRDFCETELINLVDNFVKDQNKYADLNSECVRAAEAVLVRVVCINRMMILNRTCAFDLPQKMLWPDIPPHSPVFLSILYVCAGLFSQNIHHAVADLRKRCDEEQKSPEDYVDVMRDIDFACKIYPIKLVEWYPWSDLSVTAFFSLCQVLEAIRTLPLAQNTLNLLLPLNARYLIAGFVAQMIWIKDERWGAVVKIDDSMKTWILDGFLKMIEWKALPLFYAYDALTYFHRHPAVMEKPLRRFLTEICATEEEADVVDWLMKWMTCIFNLSLKDCLDLVADFVELIHPIRNKMQNIIFRASLKGIEFALSEAEQTDRNGAASNYQFFKVLAKLGECLDESKKTAIEVYFKRNTYKKDDVKALKNFMKLLKKKPEPKKVERLTPKSKSVAISSPILSSQRSSVVLFDERMSGWSPSSVSRSSSVLADESDLESTCSELRFIICRHDGNNSANLINNLRDEAFTGDVSNDVPSVSSTPAKKPDTQTESTSQVYDNGDELVKSSQISKRPSISVCTENVSDFLANLPQSTRVNESTAQNANQLPRNLQIASVDACAIAKSLTTYGIEDGGVLRDPSILSTSAKERDTRIGNTSRVYDSASKLFKNLQLSKSPAVSVCSENASDILANLPQSTRLSPDNRVTIKSPSMSTSSEGSSDKVRDLSINIVRDDRAERLSQEFDKVATSSNSHLTSLKKEYAVEKTSSMSVLVEDNVDVPKNPSIPSISTKEPEAEIESTSQIYDNVDELLKGMQIPSIEDYAMAKSPSLSASSGDAADFAKSPLVPSTPAKELDGQIASTSQIFDNVNELLKVAPIPSLNEYAMANNSPMSTSSLLSTQSKEIDAPSEVFDNVNELLNMQIPAAEDDVASKSTPVSESSGDFTVDDILKNRSIFSTPSKESDDRAESTSQAYGSVDELLKSLEPSMLDKYALAKSPSESEYSESNDYPQNLDRILSDNPDPGDSMKTGGRISDVVKNLQRVSLSNAEVESSESSSSGFGKSPIKKKRRFRM